MAEIVCKEISCAFNQDEGCLKRVVTLEPAGVEIKVSSRIAYCRKMINCREYEPKHPERHES